MSVPYGYCHCGCGEKASIAKWTDRHKGWVRGEPKHYLPNHIRRYNGPDYIVNERGCWVWQKSLDSNGYGLILQGRRKPHLRAHRVFYEAAHGPIPEGLEPDHTCRNRACCNPDHLEPVTRAENVRRGDKTKLTEGQVREIRGLLKRGGWTHEELASCFGVSKGNISHIATWRTWKDVR